MTRAGVRKVAGLAVAGLAAGAALLAPTTAQAAVGDGPGGLTLQTSNWSTSTDPIAHYQSASACPTDYRDLAGVGFLTGEGDNAVFTTLTGNIAPTDTPPSGNLDTGSGLAQVFESNGWASGDYQIALLCFDTPSFAYVVPANVWVHVDLAAGTWNVIEGGGNPTPVTTTTALTAAPTSAVAGADVALTATVTGAGAAGVVEFFDGTTSLGTTTVSGGQAAKTVNTLAVGQHSLTAKFEPTDPNAFTSSTSDAVPVTITSASSGGGESAGETLRVTIPQSSGGGELTLAVGADPAGLAPVSAGSLEFKGSLSSVTVTDGRDQHAGWDVTGVTSDFTGDAGTLDGEWLGWTPVVTQQNQANDVVPGPAVTPGSPGLKQTATLGSAAANKGAGVCVLGGDLDLQVPPATAAGDYSATLTLTLMSK